MKINNITSYFKANGTPTEEGIRLFAVLSKIIGIGQRWQDVAASRAASTSYQNTTGRPIQVAILARSSVGTTRTIEVSENNSTWIVLGATSISTDPRQDGVTFIVPSGWYYRLNGAVAAFTWAELR